MLDVSLYQNLNFKPQKRFFDALFRQADEAVRINNASPAQLINSKSEFLRGLIILLRGPIKNFFDEEQSTIKLPRCSLQRFNLY